MSFSFLPRLPQHLKDVTSIEFLNNLNLLNGHKRTQVLNRAATALVIHIPMFVLKQFRQQHKISTEITESSLTFPFKSYLATHNFTTKKSSIILQWTLTSAPLLQPPTDTHIEPNKA